MLLRLAVTGAVAAAAAVTAWRLRWLRADGAWAAAAVGTAVYGFAGWRGAAPLAAFFVTSTLLGRLPGRAPHGARDWRQVVANGGIAAVAGVAAALHAPWALPALAGALAAANADTWATELGTRWGGAPRRLGVGARVRAGDSGGMSGVGTLGGCAGAALIGLVTGGAPVALGGVAGLLADSLLGGTAQALYRCSACGAHTESRDHDCGGGAAALRLVRGAAWLDNDGVNLLATLAGAVGAAVLAWASAPVR